MFSTYILATTCQGNTFCCDVNNVLPLNCCSHSSLADKQTVFSCLALDVTSFQWRVNEANITRLPIPMRQDIQTKDIHESSFGISTLTINARVAYNGTRVQCVVNGEHGSSESEIAILNIQGMASFSHNVFRY